MSTAVRVEPFAETSPLFKARMAGFFWLMTALTGTFALVAYDRVVVNGDAAATAGNIRAHDLLFRGGIVSDLIATACYVVATLLVYDILKPVNRNVSLLAAFFSLMGCAAAVVSFAFRLGPLVVLGSAPYLNAFTVDQLQALALTFLRLRGQASNMSFTFFGLHCFLVGCLILRSAFLPRVVGGLMVCTGSGWMTLSLAGLLSPPLAQVLSPYLTASGGLGEISLSLWLLAKGVNVSRWKDQASAAPEWRSHPPSARFPIAG